MQEHQTNINNILEDFNNIHSLKTEVCYGEEEDMLNFLEIMSSKEKDTSKHVYTKNQQQIALFIRTYVTKWNTSELQSGVYPNRRDTYPLNTTEKDILLVKNILHNREYDIISWMI